MAGNIIVVKDLVVKVQFDDDLPGIGELLAVQNGFDTHLLVDHIETGGIAICLNVRRDLRLTKGISVERTHKGIEVPIGDAIIGRIMNSLGDPLDGKPAVAAKACSTKTS